MYCYLLVVNKSAIVHYKFSLIQMVSYYNLSSVLYLKILTHFKIFFEQWQFIWILEMVVLLPCLIFTLFVYSACEMATLPPPIPHLSEQDVNTFESSFKLLNWKGFGFELTFTLTDIISRGNYWRTVCRSLLLPTVCRVRWDNQQDRKCPLSIWKIQNDAPACLRDTRRSGPAEIKIHTSDHVYQVM